MKIDPIGAENALMSAVLSDPGLIQEIAHIKEDIFSIEENRLLFSEIASTFCSDTRALEAKTGVDAKYIIDLSSIYSSSVDVSFYADIVQSRHLGERLARAIEGASNAIKEGEDPSGIIEKLETDILRINNEMTSENDPVHIADPVDAAVERLRRIAKGEKVEGNIPTGLPTLDRHLSGGLRGGELCILAAGTSVGKTAAMLNFASHMIAHDIPCLFFGMEMSRDELADRLLTMRTQKNVGNMERQPSLAVVNLPEFERAARELAMQPLTVDDSPRHTLATIRVQARRWAAQNIGGAIFIDYLQLTQVAREDAKQPRYVAIGNISTGLKALAREIDCPIIVASQFNRDAEKEPSIGKMMSHLRESGNLEQDANCVIIMRRPFDKETAERFPDNAIEMALAKNRRGPIGEWWSLFNRETQRIHEIGQEVKQPVKTVSIDQSHDPIAYSEETPWEDPQEEVDLF